MISGNLYSFPKCYFYKKLYSKNMKKIFTLLLLVSLYNFNYSQCDGRYETEIFSTVSVNTVNYSDVYTDGEHEMDIYIPDGDTETNRPVVVYMHGGSFYAGDKGSVDCVDFCTSMAKRGYVAISANYRLNQNPISFIYSQEEQFRTVLKAVADIKSVVRYLRKDHSTGNSLGVNPAGIYIGGYSAGAVLSIHMAYIDQISDLPTSPINVQNLVANIGGTLEGDSGNDGYSSEITAVFSFAGAINDLNWIDANDEPLVSVQGDADGTVSYNCAPGLGLTTVLTLCGTGEMHPQATSVGILNDFLTYPGIDHDWGVNGNGNPLFIQGTEFVVDFLYPILPCNGGVNGVNELSLNIEIFPVPASEIINLKANQKIKYLNIYNSLGKSVLNSSNIPSNSSLNVADFKSGIYLLEFVTENGNSSCKKIIIQ